MKVQVSFAAEGGSGTPVPDPSVEVDVVDEVLRRVCGASMALETGRPMNRGTCAGSSCATRWGS